MATRSRFAAGILTFFDRTTRETVLPLAPVFFEDDFLGPALDTTKWTALDTGAATEAVVADLANGAVGLALDATNEVQLAGISWNDQRTLALAQGLILEARFRLSVLPSAASVIAVIGLQGDHNAAVDTVAESIWFRADGNGQITVESDDTSHETSKVATGVTVTTADWVIGKIDCTDIADVKFYINGNRVAEGTTFNMSQVAGLALQPVARISKSAATSVGTLQVDYIRAWMNRA
ncbi:hypothetical protein [Methylocystis sp. SC2]|uniref:hypothetical protein n=1 Tax=Methylocystis sp. (strain SC2) TaxID=187303 RepID=UPI00027AF034|nr:hypothetical protein [Methylocystis sp. SC2]CCJ07092.1 Hypothetical protein BN69_1641 [Methylocystis sp. SC2]